MLCIIFANNLLAEDSIDDRHRFGLFFNYKMNDHVSNFQKFEGVPNCCPKFEKGTGTGYSIGLSWELPLPYYLRLGLKGGYSILDGSLTSLEATKVRVDSSAVDGQFEHVINAKISDFGIEPFISFNPFGGFEVFFGGHAGFLNKMTFEQYERITKPENRGVFIETNKRIRNQRAGEVPNAKEIYGSLFAGMNYHFPLNRDNSVFLAPEISYMVGQTDFVKDLKWTVNSMQFGLALKYSPKIESVPKQIFERKEINIRIDTTELLSDAYAQRYVAIGKELNLESRKIRGDTVITISSIHRTDTLFIPPKPQMNITVNTPLIYMQTQYVSQAFPILPVVFFGKDSSDIHPFYNKINKPSDFEIDDLAISPVSYHKNVLNIIGKRMQKFPNSKLSLKGNSDSTTEKGNCYLAKHRAESIQNYLVSEWGIRKDRITINSSARNCYPSEPTMTKNDSGYAENRRVELISEDDQLWAPVVQERYLEANRISPSNLKLTPDGTFLKNISSSSIVARQGSKVFVSKLFQGAPSAVNEILTTEKIANLNSGEPVTIELRATDFEGQVYTAETKISIKKDTSNTEIQRLSLILFGVSSVSIPERAKGRLKEFVRSANQGMKATVYGYSDILGTFGNNLALSERRAQNTSKFIRDVAPNLDIMEVRGIGSTEMPPGIYSYATPAERFLTRTVYIELQKKWKK